MILIDYFERTAREQPQKEFLHFVAAEAEGDVRFSYGEADRRASAIARALHRLGLRRGDTVSMLLPNSPVWLLIYLANQKIGAITGTLDPDHTPKELQYNVAHARARVLMVDRRHLDKARAMRGQCPQLEIVVLVDGVADDCVSLSEALSGIESVSQARDPAISDDDTLYIMFTCGTTSGVPKGVLHPQRSLIHGIDPYRSLVPVRPDDRLMLVTPLFHACSMYWGVTLVILAGATLVLAERFSATRFWEQALRGDVSLVWTMGTITAILLQLPPDEAERAACLRLRTIFAVGISARQKQARERWGCDIVDGFGMTETAGTMPLKRGSSVGEDDVGGIASLALEDSSGRHQALCRQGYGGHDTANPRRIFISGQKRIGALDGARRGPAWKRRGGGVYTSGRAMSSVRLRSKRRQATCPQEAP